MRVVLQRVSSASVSVDGTTVAAIDRGLVALVGVAVGDRPQDAVALADKAVKLRIFSGGGPEMALPDVHGAMLVVSQFTLLADTRRGNRPSWSGAAGAEAARELVGAFADRVAAHGIPVRHGVFGAHMEVALVNDGPVTIVLERAPADGA